MKVRGYASHRQLDHYRHVLLPNAFDESIAAKGLKGPKGIKFLWQHLRPEVIGQITKLEARKDGLWMEAEIDEKISTGGDVAAKIKAAGGLSFSVGFYVLDADLRKTPGGRDEYLEISKGDLEEVSVVVFPGNSEATIVAYD